MGRHADRASDDDDARLGWGARLGLAVVVFAATCLGIVWASGDWRTGALVGAGAAVVVVGALALGATMPARPPDLEE